MKKLQRLTYPKNLIMVLIDSFDSEYDINSIEEHFDDNWNYLFECVPNVLTLMEQQVIEMRYKRCLNLEEIGRKFEVTRERIRQIEAKAIRKLKRPQYKEYLLVGKEILSEYKSLKEQYKELIEELKHNIFLTKYSIEELKTLVIPDEVFTTIAETDIPIERLELSVRNFNCLKRRGINTIFDLVNMTEKDLMKVRNMGSKSCKEIILKLQEFGLNLKEEK